MLLYWLFSVLFSVNMFVLLAVVSSVFWLNHFCLYFWIGPTPKILLLNNCESYWLLHKLLILKNMQMLLNRLGIIGVEPVKLKQIRLYSMYMYFKNFLFYISDIHHFLIGWFFYANVVNVTVKYSRIYCRVVSWNSLKDQWAGKQ